MSKYVKFDEISAAETPKQDWETPCPKSPDGEHCGHWYDCDECHYCGDPAALAEAGIELTFDLGIVEERCRETQGYLRFACGCYRYLDRYEGTGDWHRTQVFSFYSCSPEHAAWWRENPGD